MKRPYNRALLFTARVAACATLMLASVSVSSFSQEQTQPAQEEQILSLNDFVQLAAAHDTEFEEILADELKLKYRRDIALPARDLVVSLKHEYEVLVSEGEKDSASTIGLSKLFPRVGTELSASYHVSPSTTSEGDASALSVSITQPIARNAFGRSTRMLERIVGLEVDIASHQIVEAYEDYFATVIAAHHDWQQAYEELLIGRSSYAENLKLLRNVEQRQQKQVARDVDVNKIKLQVLAKKEQLVVLEEDYNQRLLTVAQMLRHDGKSQLIPAAGPATLDDVDSFDELFREFVTTSRTFDILRMLEMKSAIEVDREADDLLPSINLMLGGEIEGAGYDLKDSEHLLFAGIELEFPLPRQVDKAEHEISRIDLRKAELARTNARYRLYTNIKDLFHEISKEKQLLAIAKERIQLGEAVVRDETENYSFGKVTLNDYISAVNALDNNRFNQIRRTTRCKKLIVELQRLTDRLITRKDIDGLGPEPDRDVGH
jgi:outer membrane protein TolC